MSYEYVCPSCKSIALHVTVSVSASLKQEENGEVSTDVDGGDHEWDGNSTMWCTECSKSGIAAEFQDDPEAEISPVFRVFPEGDVIALWGEPDRRGLISSYMHIGQHGEASKDLVNELREATEEEAKPLREELKMIGYRIEEAS